jgi:hypothetical protein
MRVLSTLEVRIALIGPPPKERCDQLACEAAERLLQAYRMVENYCNGGVALPA